MKKQLKVISRLQIFVPLSKIKELTTTTFVIRRALLQTSVCKKCHLTVYPDIAVQRLAEGSNGFVSQSEVVAQVHYAQTWRCLRVRRLPLLSLRQAARRAYQAIMLKGMNTQKIWLPNSSALYGNKYLFKITRIGRTLNVLLLM